MNFCTHCGAKVNDGMSFCPVCGHALAEYLEESLPENKAAAISQTDAVHSFPDKTDIQEGTATKEAEAKISEEASIPPEYVALPETNVSAGTIVMGVIALVLGILCLSWTIASFKLTIDIFRENVIAHHRFVRTLTSAIPGIIAIILSQKSIDNGYDSKITKAAEILGGIGAFFHIGVLFILIIDLFI